MKYLNLSSIVMLSLLVYGCSVNNEETSLPPSPSPSPSPTKSTSGITAETNNKPRKFISGNEAAEEKAKNSIVKKYSESKRHKIFDEFTAAEDIATRTLIRTQDAYLHKSSLEERQKLDLKAMDAHSEMLEKANKRLSAKYGLNKDEISALTEEGINKNWDKEKPYVPVHPGG